MVTDRGDPDHCCPCWARKDDERKCGHRANVHGSVHNRNTPTDATSQAGVGADRRGLGPSDVAHAARRQTTDARLPSRTRPDAGAARHEPSSDAQARADLAHRRAGAALAARRGSRFTPATGAMRIRRNRCGRQPPREQPTHRLVRPRPPLLARHAARRGQRGDRPLAWPPPHRRLDRRALRRTFGAVTGGRRRGSGRQPRRGRATCGPGRSSRGPFLPTLTR